MLKAGDLARREESQDRRVKGVKIVKNPTRSGDITCMQINGRAKVAPGLN